MEWAHPEAKHEAGQTLLPVRCDVCTEIVYVAVPRMQPMLAVWVGRGHKVARQTMRCRCGRWALVDLGLAARVVTLPPQPMQAWRTTCGTA